MEDMNLESLNSDNIKNLIWDSIVENELDKKILDKILAPFRSDEEDTKKYNYDDVNKAVIRTSEIFFKAGYKVAKEV